MESTQKAVLLAAIGGCMTSETISPEEVETAFKMLDMIKDRVETRINKRGRDQMGKSPMKKAKRVRKGDNADSDKDNEGGKKKQSTIQPMLSLQEVLKVRMVKCNDGPDKNGVVRPLNYRPHYKQWLSSHNTTVVNDKVAELISRLRHLFIVADKDDITPDDRFRSNVAIESEKHGLAVDCIAKFLEVPRGAKIPALLIEWLHVPKGWCIEMPDDQALALLGGGGKSPRYLAISMGNKPVVASGKPVGASDDPSEVVEVKDKPSDKPVPVIKPAPALTEAMNSPVHTPLQSPVVDATRLPPAEKDASDDETPATPAPSQPAKRPAAPRRGKKRPAPKKAVKEVEPDLFDESMDSFDPFIDDDRM